MDLYTNKEFDSIMVFTLGPYCRPSPRSEGLLTKISKQSIMIATLVLKYFWNDIGIVAISCPYSGHTIKNFILQYIRSIHLKNVKGTVDFDKSNLCIRSCIAKFNINHISVNTSSWKELSFQFAFSVTAVFNKSKTEQRISNLGSPVFSNQS